MYKAYSSHNLNVKLINDLVLSSISSFLFVGVNVCCNINPLLGVTIAPYIISGILLFHALVAGARSIDSFIRYRNIRAQLLNDFGSDDLDDVSAGGSFLRKESLIYRSKAKNYFWQSLRGLITASAIFAVLGLCVSTTPVVSSIICLTTAVCIMTYFPAVCLSKKTQVINLGTKLRMRKSPAEQVSNSAGTSLSSSSIAGCQRSMYDFRVDYIGHVKEHPQTARKDIISCLLKQKDLYEKKLETIKTPFSLFFTQTLLGKKISMINDLVKLLEHEITCDHICHLDEIVNHYRGSLISRGALSSFFKPFGGMQTLLEAVEYVILSELHNHSAQAITSLVSNDNRMHTVRYAEY